MFNSLLRAELSQVESHCAIKNLFKLRKLHTTSTMRINLVTFENVVTKFTRNYTVQGVISVEGRLRLY